MSSYKDAICKQCQKPFKARVKSNGHIVEYCSWSCYKQVLSEPNETCAYCRKELHVAPSRQKRQPKFFCSHACQRFYRYKEFDQYIANPQWLNEQYVLLGKTTWDIAKDIGCSQNLVLQRLKRFGIPRRKSGFGSKPCFAENHPRWKGGRRITKDGYVLVMVRENGRLLGKYVLEHRLVMEKHLNRPLKSGEIIHHINEDRSDNRIKNLVLVTPAAHSACKSCPLLSEVKILRKLQKRISKRHITPTNQLLLQGI